MIIHITKLMHSCLLVEAGGKTALFDPGSYSVSSGMMRAESMPKLDYVVYTHAHDDHFHGGFLKDLIWIQQPVIIGPKAVKQRIESEGVTVDWRLENQDLVMEAAGHEELPWPGSQTPDHAAYHFMKAFTHAGDSFELNKTMPILAAALVAPWGKTGDMIKMTERLKPEFVVPVHDWHLSEGGRDYYDGRLAAMFASQKVQPVRVLDAQSVALEIKD